MKITLFTIYVKNLEKAIAFYQDLLGMQIEREINPEPGMKLVFLKGEGEVTIELIADDSRQLSEAESNVSVGIYVENISAVLELLKANNIPIKSGPIDVLGGTKLLFIEDHDGVEIEFIERNV